MKCSEVRCIVYMKFSIQGQKDYCFKFDIIQKNTFQNMYWVLECGGHVNKN